MTSSAALIDHALERKTIRSLLNSYEAFPRRMALVENEDAFTERACRKTVFLLKKRICSEFSEDEFEYLQEELPERYDIDLRGDTFNDQDFRKAVLLLNDLATRRALRRILGGTCTQAAKPNCDFGQLFKRLQDELTSLDIQRIQVLSRLLLTESATDFDSEGDLFNSNDQPLGIPTGIHRLDEMLQGFLPGTLYTVIAKRGSGKTSMALSMANAALMEEHVAVGFSGTRNEMMSLIAPMMVRHPKGRFRPIETNGTFPLDFGRFVCSSPGTKDGVLDIRSLRKRSLTDICSHALDLAAQRRKCVLFLDDIETLVSDTLPFLQIRRELQALACSRKMAIVMFASFPAEDLEPLPSNALAEDDQEPPAETEVVMVLERSDPAITLSVHCESLIAPQAISLTFNKETYSFLEPNTDS